MSLEGLNAGSMLMANCGDLTKFLQSPTGASNGLGWSMIPVRSQGTVETLETMVCFLWLINSWLVVSNMNGLFSIIIIWDI